MNTRTATGCGLGQIYAFIFVPKGEYFKDTNPAQLRDTLTKLFKADDPNARAYPFPYIDDLSVSGEDDTTETFGYTGVKVKVRSGTIGYDFKHTRGFELQKSVVGLAAGKNNFGLLLVNTSGDLFGCELNNGGIRGFTIRSFFTKRFEPYTGSNLDKWAASIELENSEFERSPRIIPAVFDAPSVQLQGLANLKLLDFTAEVKASENVAANAYFTFTTKVLENTTDAYSMVKAAYTGDALKTMLTFTKKSTGEAITIASAQANDATHTFTFVGNATAENKRIGVGDVVVVK